MEVLIILLLAAGAIVVAYQHESKKQPVSQREHRSLKRRISAAESAIRGLQSVPIDRMRARLGAIETQQGDMRARLGAMRARLDAIEYQLRGPE